MLIKCALDRRPRYEFVPKITWCGSRVKNRNRENLAGEPTAVQYGTELDVFAVGTDGKTYKNTFNPSTGWGGFTALPG